MTISCYLCERNRPVVNSHIIPKFVIKKLKKNSVTGYLRSARNPNLRIQDGFKEKLLCNDCEQKLSELETYFAKEIYYPFIDSKKKRFDYDNRLNLFIVSVSLRILKYSKNGYNDWFLSVFLEMIEEYWKELLLHKKTDNYYSHYMLFLNDTKCNNIYKDYIVKLQLMTDKLDGQAVAHSKAYLKKKFKGFMNNSFGGDICIDPETTRIFIYYKFQNIIFVSMLHSEVPILERNTNIQKSGRININEQFMYDSDIWFKIFFEHQINYHQLSDKQHQIINKSIITNLDKYHNSSIYKNWKYEPKF